ncbi:hypothetical protein [Acinetobacter piscicola]|uniref:hypothetical protein n=1 Tax=Acinetobacter piscicola TaxID=2006115 RepID=UPI000B7F38C7|nr:hypothetical protein [Acinetobacter piscicola]
MNFKTLLLLGGVGFVLHGCASMNGLTSESFNQYTSPQEVIDKKNINDNNSSAKEYVYYWGPQQSETEIQSLLPKHYLSRFCAAKGGKFSSVQKSSMGLVKDIWSKKLLNTYSSVKQGIGAYQCKQSDGQQWYVSIEPISERKLDHTETRVVNLQTKLVSLDELKKLYAKTVAIPVVQEKKSTANNSKITALVKVPPVKVVEEKKPVIPPVEEEKEKPQVEKVVLSPQLQQMQLYTTARKDLGRGQNQINACNNAERAYGYGRLRGASGINIYAESGILVAKCLTSVPSYSRRFSNPQDRAKRILQNLSANQNHAVAKYMLKQMN